MDFMDQKRKIVIALSATTVVILSALAYLKVRQINTAPSARSRTGMRGAQVPQWTRGTHRSYTTNFPVTENSISEGGNWTNGKSDGVDWSDVRTSAGVAFGTQVPPTGPPYNDSVAVLKGTWNPNQMATATVHTMYQQSHHTYEEVELLLRMSISPHSSTGYEINLRCLSGPDTYVQFGYWAGPLNKFWRPGFHDWAGAP